MFDLAAAPSRQIPWRKFAALASRALPPVLMTVAAYVLWRELRSVSAGEVWAHAREWGALRIGGALFLAAMAYALLAANEILTMKWLDAGLTPRAVAPVSFMAYAFGNSIGLNLLVATAVRIRSYRRHKVDLGHIAAAGAWSSQMFWGGLAALAGSSLLAAGQGAWRVGGGALLLLLPIGLVAASALFRRPFKLFRRTWRLPPPRFTALQLVNAIGVNLALAGVFFLLLNRPAGEFFAFAGAYAVSLAVGLLSGAPGGLGVFESAMLTLSADFDVSALAAAFIGYRIAYFILPLLIAAVMLLVREHSGTSEG